MASMSTLKANLEAIKPRNGSMSSSYPPPPPTPESPVAGRSKGNSTVGGGCVTHGFNNGAHYGRHAPSRLRDGVVVSSPIRLEAAPPPPPRLLCAAVYIRRQTKTEVRGGEVGLSGGSGGGDEAAKRRLIGGIMRDMISRMG